MNNVIFTKATIYRNLKDYKFVPKLDQEKTQEIEEKVGSSLGSVFHKIDLSSADIGVVTYLKDNALIGKNTKIVFVNKQKTVSVSLFENEHIHIRSTGFGFAKSATQTAITVASKLAEKLSMAYSDDYGYLMSDLSHIGTALKLDCDLDLNAIVAIGKIEQVKQNVRKLGLLLMEKEPNIFTLSTVCNLGFTEKEIISEFEKMTVKLQEVEIESAKMLQVSKHDEVMDRAMRAKAILSSAYIMSTDELKMHLSVLRTGLNLGIIEISAETFNKLQKLVINKNSQIVSQSELVSLAEKVRNIVKGE